MDNSASNTACGKLLHVAVVRQSRTTTVDEQSEICSSDPQRQGCSPKKEVGGRPKQDLDRDFFKQFRPLHTRTLIHVRKIATADLWSCPAIQLLVFECLQQMDINFAVLKLSYTAFQ